MQEVMERPEKTHRNHRKQQEWRHACQGHQKSKPDRQSV